MTATGERGTRQERETGMQDGRVLGREEILASIPHRGRNRVLDSVAFFEEEGALKSRSRVRIARGDPEGRDIFLQRTGEKDAYSEFILVEHVALTSAVQISPDTGPGSIAFFSTITNFRGKDMIPAGEEVSAVVTPLGRRGPFHRSRCVVEGEGEAGPVMSVELMAAVMPAGSGEPGGEKPAEKKAAAPPAIVEERPVDPGAFLYKDPAMVFVAEETALDRNALALTARYRYPEDHPLVPGHFPGNPVMMGVTQWMGVVDGARWLIHRLGLPAGTYDADGELVREDGTLVTEIKSIRFTDAGRGIAPRVLATKRIGFRDMVRAGETVYVRVRLARRNAND